MLRGELLTANYGQIDAVKALLTHNPSTEDVEKALKLANLNLQSGVRVGYHPKVIKILEQELTGRELIVAAYQGDRTKINALLSIPNINVDVVDANNMTPLMFAANSGELNVVNALLNAHASVDMVNKEGWNALMFAVDDDALDVVNALLFANPKSNTIKKALELFEKQEYSNIALVLKEKLTTLKRKRNL